MGAGRTNKPGRQRISRSTAAERQRVSVPDKTLDDMLLGRARSTRSSRRSRRRASSPATPNMVRLVPNYVEVETEYFRRTAFSDHAFCAIQRTLFEKNKWTRESLSAFEEAKERKHRAHPQHDDLAFPASAVGSPHVRAGPARCFGRGHCYASSPPQRGNARSMMLRMRAMLRSLASSKRADRDSRRSTCSSRTRCAGSPQNA